MTRTNKRGIAKSKQQQSKKGKKQKCDDMQGHFKKIASMKLDDLKLNWLAKEVVNPLWRAYFWFTKWRKVCLDTKLKFDPDGFWQYDINANSRRTSFTWYKKHRMRSS